jgi:predicted RNA-binding protein
VEEDDKTRRRAVTASSDGHSKKVRYLFAASTYDNFSLTCQLLFRRDALSRYNLKVPVQGFSERYRRILQKVQPGDFILYYIRGMRAFAGTVVISSTCFEDHSVIWKSYREGEVFPIRVAIKPRVVLKPDSFILAKDIAYRLDMTKGYPPEDWHLAFIEDLKEMPETDFKLIDTELQRIRDKTAVAAG